MIELRPHHLLCTQGYSGKGYSTSFVNNMDSIVDRLRNFSDEDILIVFSTDSICTTCPSKLGENRCITDQKVNNFDQKVRDYFNIEEKRYHYQTIIREINSLMTSDMLDDICATCEWYPISMCRKKILGTTDPK